jgi:hypothetical protein
MFDEPREDGPDFTQPANIETLQGSHGLCLPFVLHKASHLR